MAAGVIVVEHGRGRSRVLAPPFLHSMDVVDTPYLGSLRAWWRGVVMDEKVGRLARWMGKRKTPSFLSHPLVQLGWVGCRCAERLVRLEEVGKEGYE